LSAATALEKPFTWSTVRFGRTRLRALQRPILTRNVITRRASSRGPGTWAVSGAGGPLTPFRRRDYTRTNSLPLLAATKPLNTSLTWSHDLSFFMLSSQRLTLG